MPVVSLIEASKTREGFYVPLFEVRIKDVGLPDDVLRDVIQLTYKDTIKGIDSFELTVNNWDPDTNTFKYVGGEVPKDLEDNRRREKLAQRYRLFEPCNEKVEIHMGYLNNLELMMTGNFTTMEPNFPSGGASTLTVRGLNVLHQLRRKQYTDAWVNKTDSQIARSIGTRKDPKAKKKKRFPFSIEVDKHIKEEKIDYVTQRNQYDIDFLFARARLRGYVVTVNEDKKQISFLPSDAQKDPLTYELEWGKSLIDFKPSLTTANQIKSITVNGWDRRRNRPIQETVTLDDPKLNKNRDLYELLKRCDPREEEVVDKPVFTKKEARQLAIDMLKERQKEIVKASGTTVGLPQLRAGRHVQIKGLGPRFNGKYLVTETTHTINDSGYITRFNARREDEGGGKKG